MNRSRMWLSVMRINLPLSFLFLVSLIVSLVYGDNDTRDILPFAIPLTISLLIFLPSLFMRKSMDPERMFSLIGGIISFLFLALVGSLPFMLSGSFGPVDSLFESFAGFTTTGLSGFDPRIFLTSGRGMLFYRVAIQWVGGLFYLVTAFKVLSELNDIVKRSAERRIFVRMGLVPTLSNLLYNLTIIYLLFSLLFMLVLRISGRSIFDSICISMATVSTGGYASTGIVLDGGPGLHLIVIPFMIAAGMGYHVHLSLLSARNRRRTVLDPENLIYLSLVIAAPVIIGAILFFSGSTAAVSAWKGAFAAISAMSTTGTSIEGIDSFPDAAKLALLLLMLIGGSSMSMTSGFKVQRILLLFSALIGEVKRTAHPGLVQTLKRGESIYSPLSLESAGSAFAITVLAASSSTLLFLALEGGDIFSVTSLIITSISNTGISFGIYSTVDGISSLNPLLKVVLSIVMFIGRFEILLPLHLLTYSVYPVFGRSRSILRPRE